MLILDAFKGDIGIGESAIGNTIYANTCKQDSFLVYNPGQNLIITLL